MLKVRANPSKLEFEANRTSDMEYEEERGRGSEEAAKDQRGSDPCAERCAFYLVKA